MKSFVVILSIFLAIDYTMAAQKLQIGIKKRVENCEMKAQKGDLVHVHYTVRETKHLKCNVSSAFCQINSIYILETGNT